MNPKVCLSLFSLTKNWIRNLFQWKMAPQPLDYYVSIAPAFIENIHQVFMMSVESKQLLDMQTIMPVDMETVPMITNTHGGMWMERRMLNFYL